METRTQPTLGGFLESAIYVKDVERSVSFYSGILGFQALVREERFCAMNVANQLALLIFECGSARQPTETARGVIPSHDGQGTLHLAFSIAESELDRWEEWLRGHAVPLESKVRWPRGGTSVYFRDPDDHLVELATPGVWSIY